MNQPDPLGNKRALVLFLLALPVVVSVYGGVLGVTWHWMLAMWR